MNVAETALARGDLAGAVSALQTLSAQIRSRPVHGCRWRDNGLRWRRR